jgi:antitoxin HigA-1
MARLVKCRPPVHPGRILKEDLLDPLGLVRGIRAVTPDTSLRLGRYFGLSPDYWLRVQMHHDFELARRSSLTRIEREVRPRKAA